MSAVGPVLDSGAIGRAVLRAILETHPMAEIVDRGSYVRVLVEKRCVLRRELVEKHLGAPFELPENLESVMPAFQGTLTMAKDEATWTANEDHDQAR